MKFFRMFEQRIMNEAGSDSHGGGSSAGTGGGSDSSSNSGGETSINDVNDYSSEDHELDSKLADNTGSKLASMGLDPKKYGIENETDDGEETIENEDGTETAKVASPATDEKATLAALNALGMIYKDSPLQVESLAQAKELIQKGMDHTQKTQALSYERKDFETERDNTRTELNAAIDDFNTNYNELAPRLQLMDQWDFTLNEIKDTNPDLHSEIVGHFQGTQKQWSNPVQDKRYNDLKAEFDEIKKGLTSREDETIINGFESDRRASGATEQSWKELGINVDWEGVKKSWAETGLPLEQVLWSKYGPAVAKAQASKAKVSGTQTRTQPRKTQTAAGSSRAPGGKSTPLDPKLSHRGAAHELAKKYGVVF